MRKHSKILMVGAAAVTAVAPVATCSATMTVANIENFYTMPLTITRVDYKNDRLAVALRGDVTHINIVTVSRDGATFERTADEGYETMGEGAVEWGNTVFNGDVSELPRNQEVWLDSEEHFYDDYHYLIYYAVSFADGGHFEGKLRYAGRCVGPLSWGNWDPETGERVQYSDEEYECRIRKVNELSALSEGDGAYMSQYTQEVYTEGWLIRTGYAYELEKKSERMTGLPVDIKTFEDLADEAELAEQERLAEEARLEAERLAEEAKQREEALREEQRQAELKEAQEARAEALAKVERAEAEMEEAKALMEEAKQRADEVEAEVQTAREELAALGAEAEKLKGELADKEADLVKSEAEAARLEAEVARLETEMARLQPETARLQSEVVRLETEVARLETEVEFWRKEVEFWKAEAAKVPETVTKYEEKNIEKTVYVKEVEKEQSAEACSEKTGVEEKKDDNVMVAAVTPTVPELDAKSVAMASEGSEGWKWWVLLPATALATFLLSWWVLPEVRYKKK